MPVSEKKFLETMLTQTPQVATAQASVNAAAPEKPTIQLKVKSFK
jgi:hypothetical protein